MWFVQGALRLFKADINAAYRRVPIAPAHRQFGQVAWKIGGNVFTSQHLSMPFGAKASVHNWDRIGTDPDLLVPSPLLCVVHTGSLISAIARRVLKIGVLRFVDDYFTAERERTATHAMQCFARSAFA